MEAAGLRVNTDPTEAQKEAGNYKKAHVSVAGMDITIENPKGSVRRGTDLDGKTWEATLPATYGYVKGTEARDGDHVDVYVGDQPTSPKVFVIDQVNPDTMAYDEPKAMLGFNSREEALATYEQAFTDGRGAERVGAVTEMNTVGFKHWLKNGDTTEPLSYTGTPQPVETPSAPAAQQSAAPAPVDVKQRKAPTQKGPQDIIQFLAGQGGVQDFKGELRAIDAHKVFVPGVGKLMREKGVPLDTAREAAAEMGYFDGKYGDRDTAVAKSTVPDLLDLIAETRRGNRQYASGEQGAAQEPEKPDRLKEEVEAVSKEHGLQLDDAQTFEILDRIANGMTVEEAVVDVIERSAVAFERETHDVRGQGEPNLDDIPFFDEAPVARAAGETRQSAQDQGRERQGADTGAAGRGETPREEHRGGQPDEGQGGQVGPSEEPGAEGKPQIVIPGAERISQKQQAEREAEKPMRPKVPQKDAGELFDTQARSERQDDLFSAKPKAEARTAAQPAGKIEDFGEKIEGEGRLKRTGEALQPTDAFKSQAQAIGKRLRAELDRLGLKDVGLKLEKQINAFVDGEMQSADGSYFRGLITIALDAKNPDLTLFHEVIHALRDLGLITNKEWAILERLSRKRWIDHYKIKDVYAGFSDEVHVEEGVAHAATDWLRGRQMDGMVVRIFKKAMNFLERVGNVFRGLGFKSADDVFGQVASGEIGNRARGVSEGGERFKLRSEPESAEDGQQTMQGMIARGQPLDRALRMPFQFFGGLDEKGRWKPGLRLSEQAGKIITTSKIDPHGRFGWLAGPVEAARAGLIDRYGLSPEYIERDRQRHMDERAITMRGAEVLKTLADQNVGPNEARVLQAILTGEQVTDADMQRLAAPIRQAIDELGQEAVSLGLVSAESFERNRGTYLHRVYAKHEAEQNNLQKLVGQIMGRKRKQIIGDELKGRGLFWEVDNARLMRDIPAFQEGQRGGPVLGEKFRVIDNVLSPTEDMLSGEQRGKVARRVYVPADQETPAQYIGPEWRDNGVWEVRKSGKDKVTLWRDYTQAERAKMGEILDARYTIGKTYLYMAHDLATGRFYKDIAENEDWASSSEPGSKWVEADQFRRHWNDREVGWVKVPDTTISDTGGKKRWGALAGKWVRSEIWRDLNEIDVMNRPSTWRMLLTQWKLNKALALDTPIPTPAGWTTMGEIKVGDQVFDERGQVCFVEEVKDIQHGRPCYEVGFSDGAKIVADDEHWWFVVGRNNTKGKVLTTAEIRATLKERTRGDCNHGVPVAGALELPTADLPLPAYALGMWLGDGAASGPRMTVGGAEIDEVERELAQVGVHVGKRCQDKRSTAVSFAISTKPIRLGNTPNPFKQGLKALGVLDAKHVPDAYLRAGVAQRMALLQGLMDSDGWITERGTCGFATSSRTMLQGAMELLRSLGYKPTISEKTALGRPSWRIHFQAYADAPVFRLQKKLSRMLQRPANRQRSSTRQIVSVTAVPSVPVRCIAVSSPSHLYLAGDGMVPTHNTARSPVVHMNNIMSNLMLMDMQDVRMQDLQAGLRSFITKDKHWQDANEHGVFGADMMTQEIRDNVLKPILEEIERQGQDGTQNSFLARAGILGKFADRLWNVAKTVDRKMIDLYRVEDDVFRLASYRAGIARGETPEHAAAAAREQFLDYDIRAPWVNAARNSLLPFISYTYRAVPLIARAMATRPWKLAKYAMVAYALNALAYAWDDDGDEDKERASLRDKEQGYTWLGTPRMLRMPFRNQDGLPVFLDVRRWIPGGDVFDTNQGSSAVPIPAPLQFGGPLMLAFELALNKSGFTGEPITNDLTDNWWDKTSKVGDYLWKAWLPSAAWVPNSFYWTKIGNAINGATDAKGRPYSLPEAISSSFGIKMKPQDVETGLFWHYKDIKDVDQALRAEARTLARQRERNLISQKAFDAGMQSLLDKRDRLVERVKELQRVQKK